MFWAAYYGIKKTVLLFVKGFGVSPFIKTFLQRNALMAIVKGIELELNLASK